MQIHKKIIYLQLNCSLYRTVKSAGENNDLSPAFISYAFFSLSALLTRNESATIPDQVLERIFNVLELLFRWWWWTCEDAIWEQVLTISVTVVGGLVGKGKNRERADETKEAATRLLLRCCRISNQQEKVLKRLMMKHASSISRVMLSQRSSYQS